MSTSNLSPRLPSGQQMYKDDVPAAVQEQVRDVAVQVLQRLFAPILRRRRLRQARRAVEQRLLSQHASWEEVAAAALDALHYTSFLGAVMHDVDTAADGGRALTIGGGAEALGGAKGAFEDVFKSSHVQVSVHLHGELLEWELEPASEVLVLVGGSLRRRGTAVAVGNAAASTGGGAENAMMSAGGGASRRDSVASGGPALLGAGRHASVVAPSSRVSCVSNVSRNSAVLPSATFTRRSSTGSAQEHETSASGAPGAACAPATESNSTLAATPRAAAGTDADTEWLAAPQVLGELECLGGFPYCAALSVSSLMAIVVRIPKVVYCHMLGECVPPGGQRRLLAEALQARERLLPYFAPLTEARLRMCPLLTRLHKGQLDHLRELVVPRVYAAGMECGERERPKHIFFIRRGVVLMQRKASVLCGGGGGDTHNNNSESASPPAAAEDAPRHVGFSLECPKHRPVLVEGHTYGETGCIFEDPVGEYYTAVTHVDMYLLPFQVVIQLMKQEPEVHSIVYHSAKEFSSLRDKEWPGAVFGPRLAGVELCGVHGVVPAMGALALMAGETHDGVGSGGASGRRGRGAAESGAGGDSALRGTAGRWGSGSNRAFGSARRVTIFEAASPLGGMGNRGGGVGRAGSARLTGGRVSSGLLSAMEQLPLVSLCPGATSDFCRACLQHWQCVRYKKGDVIVASGTECSGLLMFFEGRAGVVMNASLVRREMQTGPFGRADIASAPAAAVCPIPPGHAVGYTCVRRHRWSRSIVALDDVVEVWEMRRNAFVQLLRAHEIERIMQVATLQVLQPLAVQEGRLALLDHQPLLRPMPSSLWSEQAVPNVHPVVVTNKETVCFPVWLEGDFPLDSRHSTADATARMGGAVSRRSALSSFSSMRPATTVSEMQRSTSRLDESVHLRARRSSSVVEIFE